ncbi:glutamine amidotransferase-like class 1 domain-containing protein 3A, mitochondrial isoform X2 [Mauremys reevesii]|uniref:glutamine amidotransferase-like class 1 domain-containing protein 3A, mitochondrial isoform X2 n=1 Tax=Mauremys reevesii TaxID=260615 RepID=UPI0019401695|nr:glutamine amidotransferase-like class 1 domain-containing protein 3A, mitochondrial isoform X2 [Mauremys reevesii]
MGKKVAIVLSGCGVYDGSEIHESSAVLVHLSREGAQGEFYAPDVEQMHVVDHVKGQPTQEKRNVLVESARIARGNIKDLATLNVKELDALIIPGGFGVAKNLSTWATQGKNCTISKVVEDTLKAFHAAKKPIGMCCISPVLAAKIFPGCELTVGQDKECEKDEDLRNEEDEEVEKDEDSSQHASGETILPDSQELFVTLDNTLPIQAHGL